MNIDLFNVLVCMCVHAPVETPCHSVNTEVREASIKGSFFSFHQMFFVQALNLGCQVSCHAPLPAKPSHWSPNSKFLYVFLFIYDIRLEYMAYMCGCPQMSERGHWLAGAVGTYETPNMGAWNQAWVLCRIAGTGNYWAFSPASLPSLKLENHAKCSILVCLCLLECYNSNWVVERDHVIKNS